MSNEKLRRQIGEKLDELPREAHPVDVGTIAGSIDLDESGVPENEVHEIIAEEAAKRNIPVGKASG
ncbi:hypothetical protein [Pararhizobium mangrovi]|uniref:Uncharacterized protein n=1 Tax=Pararhizobium mangrovi TaxID=2590452 RepID=A0A506TYK7_9HYPH|nr:hypothetical protein [Pararhizobium mangrovi]TPW26406.1 hypothetical protein FJU11_15140 [Pararhizobium mangrovi]